MPNKQKRKEARQPGRQSLIKRFPAQLRLSISNTLVSINILSLFQTDSKSFLILALYFVFLVSSFVITKYIHSKNMDQILFLT